MVQSARCLDSTPGTNADCTAQAGLWNYAKNFTYNAAGAVSSMKLGNGRFENTAFNSRLQPTQVGLGSSATDQALLKLNYDYGTTANNGNVLLQTITVPTVGQTTGFVATQTYSYDSLNRLKLASENITPNGGSQTPSWQQTYTFDRYGNRNFDEANTTTLPKDCTESGNPVVCEAIRPIVNPSVNTANNRLNGYTFDAAGNTIQDAEGRSFIYDGENKQVEVKNSQNQVIGKYYFDGDGKRVKKIVPAGVNGGAGETTVFVYDASAKLVAEYSTVVEPQSTAKISYLTSDHLGSPRILTDQNGAVISRRDFMPFGEEINSGTGGRSTSQGYVGFDSIRQKFTGYERDAENDLDFAQARMYGFSHGRFTSPDPLQASARARWPQTWNRYLYVLNNPLRFIDPEGLEIKILNEESKALLLGTLPEKIRKQVEQAIDKNGVIKKGALDKIKSTDQNFLDLKEIVNDKRILEITTGTGFKNPGEERQEFFYQTAAENRQEFVDNLVASGTTKEEAEKFADEIEKEGGMGPVATYGVFQTPQQTGGNARVTISDASGPASNMPIEERVGTMGRETYGHALLYFRGKPFGHCDRGSPPDSFYKTIEERSKANFRGPQKLVAPSLIKPKN